MNLRYRNFFLFARHGLYVLNIPKLCWLYMDHRKMMIQIFAKKIVWFREDNLSRILFEREN